MRGDLWHQETRVPGLSCGVVCVILRFAVLVVHRLVTDGQTQGHGFCQVLNDMQKNKIGSFFCLTVYIRMRVTSNLAFAVIHDPLLNASAGFMWSGGLRHDSAPSTLVLLSTQRIDHDMNTSRAEKTLTSGPWSACLALSDVTAAASSSLTSSSSSSFSLLLSLSTSISASSCEDDVTTSSSSAGRDDVISSRDDVTADDVTSAELVT